jgi:hypothetical protein
MTVLLEEKLRRNEAPTIDRAVPAEVPPGPPTEPVRDDEWRWVPDPADVAPSVRPSPRSVRLLRVYAWARTIGF